MAFRYNSAKTAAGQGERLIMPKVTIVNERKEIDVDAGSNLRKEIMKSGFRLYYGPAAIMNCRGFGLCGTCTVLVKKGMENLSTKGPLEKVRLALKPFATIGHENEIRLACQVRVDGDCSIETRHSERDVCGENFWQKPYPNK
jgi:ferredoxin